MKDPRIQKLVRNILHYSLRLQPGENLLIELFDEGEDIAAVFIKEAYALGANPFLSVKNRTLLREILLSCSYEQIDKMAALEAERMQNMQAYVVIRGPHNASDWSDIPGSKMNLYQSLWFKKVHTEIRVPKTKWCIIRYPSNSMAQMANMSTEAFEDFYFNVCTLDYEKMSRAMEPLMELMRKTDQVRLLGRGTDLSFSIKNMPIMKAAGEVNIPDGEVFTVPVKNSANGYITYNTPSEYQGYTYENVRLEFKEGKIIQATANNTARLNQVLDTDEGARYIGEFAIGVNPYITKPMKDILFDEKISGSIHFTPGSSCESSSDGPKINTSAVHWDLVYIQRPEFGGGEIWFDDLLVRQDGLFVPDFLKCLNPENLK